MKIRPMYQICQYCGEEILEGEDFYRGIRGAYCAGCLNEMDAKEFLLLEGEHLEAATAEYPDMDEAV